MNETRWALCVLALLADLGMLGWGFQRQQAAEAALQRYSTTHAQVTASKVLRQEGVEIDGDKMPDTCLPVVEYQYTVDDRLLKSDRITALPYGYGSCRQAEKIVASAPVGAVIRAYYDRNRPGKVFIIRGVEPQTIGIYGAGIIGLGVLLLRLLWALACRLREFPATFWNLAVFCYAMSTLISLYRAGAWEAAAQLAVAAVNTAACYIPD